jgi:hypothetical protein
MCVYTGNRDNVFDDVANECPIEGLSELRIKNHTLRACIRYATSGSHPTLPTVQPCVELSQLFPKFNAQIELALDAGRDAQRLPGNSLTVDEAAAIHLYTQETKFYKLLNSRLRSESRPDLLCFLPYLRLLLDGLYRLPLITDTVYRGVRLKLAPDYAEGKYFIWWSITSTSARMDVSARLLSLQHDRTVFAIHAQSLVDITQYSAIKSEREIILLPGIPSIYH